MIREQFFYDLSQFMESKISDLKNSGDETLDAFIESVQNYVHSDYLRESYKRLFDSYIDEKDVHYNVVWEELRKHNISSTIEIIKEIKELLSGMNVAPEKVIIYLMHEFARVHPEKFFNDNLQSN